MSAKTIAIATHKGGTGKTVTAMALGAGLAWIPMSPRGANILV